MPDIGRGNTIDSKDLEAQIALARQGDHDACRKLYERHKAGIFTLALRLCGDRAEAEDAVQEIFIKAFRGLSGYRGESSFATWLYRIAVNCCRGRLRSGYRGKLVPLDRVEVGGSGDQRRTELRAMLEAAISRLPEGYREVFVLHDVQGMSHAEIAAILGCAEGSARSQLWKARGKLREMIAPQLENESYYEMSELEPEAAEPAG